jgi:hypothetical protein
MDTTIGICLALVAAAPFLIHRYVRGLPVAPACPSCSAITRETRAAVDPFRVIPHLTATSLGECTRCGWRGRMRWKWATRAARRQPH